MNRRVLKLALLAPVPLLALGIGLLVIQARGPYWLGTNYDPAYPYLFNALRLARAQPAALTEHPGTPVQALGAAVIRILYLFDRGSAPLDEYVLRNAESCLRSLVLVLMLLYGGALALAGHAVLVATRRAGLVLLVLVTPFLSKDLLYEVVDFKPESLLCALSALLAACLAATLAEVPPPTARMAVTLGVLVGASVATKYTAAALLAAPLILLPGLRGKALSAFAALCTFILMTLPALPGASRSLGFAWKVATGGGLYGSGKFTALYWPRLGEIVREEELVFVLVVLASSVVAGLTALRRRRTGLAAWQSSALRLLVALIAVDAVQVGLFFLHPYVARYLIPALGLQGLNLAVMARLACWRDSGELRRPVAAVVLLAVVAAIGLYASRLPVQLDGLRQIAAGQKQARRAAQLPGCTIVYFPRSSSPAMALKVGDIFAGQSFRGTLEKIHPSARFLWEYRTDGRPRWPGRGTLSSEGECLVFQGAPGGRSHGFEPLSAFDPHDFPVPGRVEVVFQCPWEAVFRVDRRQGP